jgi:TolB protein
MRPLFSSLLYVFVLPLSFIIGACAEDNLADPNPETILLDGRGGGVVAYCLQPTTGDGPASIYAVNADGSGNVKIVETGVDLRELDWSSDALRFAAASNINDSTRSIFAIDAGGGNPTRLTNIAGVLDHDPAWSPDGSQIAFTRFYPTLNREQIWVMNDDGGEKRFIGIEGGCAKWSPGGKRLIYHSLKQPGGNYDIYSCNLDGSDERQLTTGSLGEITPVWSPDGLHIAYTAVGGGFEHNVYVMEFDGANVVHLTDDGNGGSAPRWSPDGSLIAYHSNGDIYVTDIDGSNRTRVTASPDGMSARNPVWRPTGVSDYVDQEIDFPVQPAILVQGAFGRCEGITFNGAGDLYVAGDRTLWRVDTRGKVTAIASAYSNLGLAPIDSSDILFADFGPTNAFDHGYNRDGIVWRVSPDGTKTAAAQGMGDPNFVLVLEDGSFLVSDDATDEIFIVTGDGSVSIFTQQVDHPNGMAISKDGTRLYVAQMFTQIKPYFFDGRVWMLRLDNNVIQGEPEVVADFGDAAANDGLTMDVLGRIYVACWRAGQIWRFNPHTGDRTLIAENVPGVASMAFGRGEFDHTAIYATSTQLGVVWKVPVGIAGIPLHR